MASKNTSFLWLSSSSGDGIGALAWALGQVPPPPPPLDPATCRDALSLSASCALPFPLSSNRIGALAGGHSSSPLFPREEVLAHAAAVRPVLHTAVAPLLDAFLRHKRGAGGSAVERQLYGAPGFDAAALVQRLLTKRPLAFLCSSDSFLLRDGVTSGYGGFEAVGTDAQRPSLALAEYMSYDEIGLAALLGVSCPTHFINSGGRGNCGAHGAAGSFEQRGVYVGLVGARFEKEGLMEWRHMRVTPR